MNNEIDKMIENMFINNPLMKFSVYTQIQFSTLKRIRELILVELDSLFYEDKNSLKIDGQKFNEIYGLFWLWILGAYEIVRTMCQRKSCFKEEVYDKLDIYKRKISAIRMPFAKQEIARTNKTISNEASISGIHQETKDLSFTIGDNIFYMRETMCDFIEIISSISIDDINRDLRDWVKEPSGR